MTTADQQTRLPRNLKEAIDLFEQPNSIPRQMLGDAFVDHYATHKRHEWNTWSDAITDWELQRYLEFA
jgi:glutamine synthetase